MTKSILDIVFLIHKEYSSFSIIPLENVLESLLPLPENTLWGTSCPGSIHPMATGSLVLQWGSVSRPASQDFCFLVASPQMQTFLSAHSGRIYLLMEPWIIHAQHPTCCHQTKMASHQFSLRNRSPREVLKSCCWQFSQYGNLLEKPNQYQNATQCI